MLRHGALLIPDNRTFFLRQLLPAMLQAMQVLLPLRRAAGRPPSQLHAMLDRGLLKLAKTVTDILNDHPW